MATCIIALLLHYHAAAPICFRPAPLRGTKGPNLWGLAFSCHSHVVLRCVYTYLPNSQQEANLEPFLYKFLEVLSNTRFKNTMT
ncbi:uncharacterized protein GGS25DRAFT_192465 [Hypoxylon fragiforme]|uniref:uncharacterized protein n=1 Tax=Hypoxylon fragiforme TaxID=63214 RepID=UPI0020C7275C|nr:uncharacterized protein GGS25DRAFT_192465 [Hypoxylon fragiforme]KAI2611358.1 hypothetical protein GGS25DRAFT_192465 [Hypoxylon fragiforme]